MWSCIKWSTSHTHPSPTDTQVWWHTLTQSHTCIALSNVKTLIKEKQNSCILMTCTMTLLLPTSSLQKTGTRTSRPAWMWANALSTHIHNGWNTILILRAFLLTVLCLEVKGWAHIHTWYVSKPTRIKELWTWSYFTSHLIFHHFSAFNCCSKCRSVA